MATAALTQTFAAMGHIRKEFCKFGVLFACTVDAFLGLWRSQSLHFGSPEGSGAPFWEPRGHSLDVLGSVGLILGSLEVSWVPWLIPLGPDWRLGSQPLNFSQFFHVILGAILGDF